MGYNRDLAHSATAPNGCKQTTHNGIHTQQTRFSPGHPLDFRNNSREQRFWS